MTSRRETALATVSASPAENTGGIGGTIEVVPCSELHYDPANVRRHGDRNIEAIKASLSRFGQQRPILVSRTGVVVAGNGTLTAARALGWESIQVVRTALEGAEATAYAIADNRTAELAEWDEEALAAQLRSIAIDDAELAEACGFDEKEMAAMGPAPEVVEDEVPEPPATPVTQHGDIIVLGRHRLMCGDATNADHVRRVLDGHSPALCITDPPYGVSYDGGAVNAKKRETLAGDETAELYAPALRLASEHMPSGAWYIWHADRYAEPVYEAIDAAGYEVRALIIWHKLKAHYGAPSAHYCQKHEPCLYAVRGSAQFIGPSNETTVWEIDQPAVNEFHPTQKPVALFARAIRNHAADVVYDPFLGSGTTLIAAEQLGRTCYGMEISPAYCDVIVQRWEALTGQKAVRP